ncbi:MAG: hypothetical protein RXR41_06375 [Candidatus Marsarchaeota archaeon]
MKFGAELGIPTGLMIALSAALTVSPAPLLSTMVLLIGRKRIMGAELSVVGVSALALWLSGHFSLFPYTERTLTYVNLYLIAGEYLDRRSLLGLAGRRALPLVLALNYFPLFLSVSSRVAFYARTRGITADLRRGKPIFFLRSIALPVIVETVRVAENLYMAYSLKLYGGLRGISRSAPSRSDWLFLLYGVAVLCSSFIPRF